MPLSREGEVTSTSNLTGLEQNSCPALSGALSRLSSDDFLSTLHAPWSRPGQPQWPSSWRPSVPGPQQSLCGHLKTRQVTRFNPSLASSYTKPKIQILGCSSDPPAPLLELGSFLGQEPLSLPEL